MGLGAYVNGYYDVSAQLPNYLLHRAQEQIRRTKAEKEAIHSVEQFEQRKLRLRKYFDELIGGMPAERTPLNAVCTGFVERDEYTIRKVVYQSLPGVYVTANLYVPRDAEVPMPAVLFTCGHIEAGKAAPIYQKVCIDLVRSGMVVLAVDPISQGERMQGYDPVLGRTLVRWHAEHTYLGLQCELAGRHVLRYFVWDLIRSIDYLCGLEEVDATRIGVTGNSGGGIQTLMAMLADERIAAAAPCTYMTSREAYMKTGQPQDGEQILDAAIPAGMDYEDYLTMFAPKPVLIGAVESDFFCLEGTLDSFEGAKRTYGLYGKENAVTLALAKGTHAFNDELRRMVVTWFGGQFKGSEQSKQLEKEPIPERTGVLQCTVSGQVLAEYSDAISIQADNARVVPELQRQRMLAGEADPVRSKDRVAQWLRMPEYRDRIYPRVIDSSRVDRAGNNLDQAFLREDIFFFSEPDITVGGTWVKREGGTHERATVLLQDEGAKGIHVENEWLEQLTADSDVLAFDPRGIGAFRSRPVNGRDYDMMFGTEYKLTCDARMLGAPLAGMRVFDTIRALDYVAQLSPSSKLAVAGKGFAAIYALLAGIVDDRVDRIELVNMPRSFAEIVENRFYTYDVRLHVYGVLRYFDLPELVETFREVKQIKLVELPDVGNIVRW
jgi:cephalosporin-C deacetylase-like acetyl esterase